MPVAGLRDRVREIIPRDGAGGVLLLAIPTAADARNKALAACRTASALDCGYPFAIGFPWNALTIRDLGTELIALETVRVDTAGTRG